MSDWLQDTLPKPQVTVAGKLRVIWRGVRLGLLVYGGLLLLLVLRLVERPLFGQARPWTPHVTQFVCRKAFAILRIGYVVTGCPMTAPGAIVEGLVARFS